MKEKKFLKGFKDEHGAILITVALTLTLMLFMVALVVDIGMAYHTKSKLQTASDSVALSVAHSACDGISDFNPQVYATQSSILINSAKVYFEENGIDDFDEIFERGKNVSDGNEFSIVWNLDKKDTAMSYIKDDTDAVLIFYKSTPTTYEVTGSRYIEIFTHLKNHTIFGAFSGYETFNLYAQSAAKCDYVAGGTPEALSYQILNLDPTEDFDITGPIENTFVKSITTFTENMTNSALDFLQNNTYFISKYIMGGSTRMTCPNTSCSYRTSHDGNAYVDSESKFWRDATTNPAAPTNGEGEYLDGYYCPYCGYECSKDDSNRVSVQLTTSAAVLNGVIHSNGGANIDIDTFRMRSQLNSAVQSVECENCHFTGAPEEYAVRYLASTEDGTEDTIIFLCPECNHETEISFDDYATQNGISGSDDYFYYYATGSKEGKRPLLMVTGDYGTVKFTGRSKNAVYFAHVQNGYTSTIYKSKDQAAAWDLNRAPSIAQIVYNSPKVEDPLLISYVRERFHYDDNNNLTNTINVNNIAKSKSIPYTKDNASPAYIVSFGDTTDSGTNYSFDRSTGTLSISGTIADYTRANQPPWCQAEYSSEIQHILLNKEVYRIGDYAFFGLSNLESITLSESVTSIGKYAFNGCRNLTTIYVPSTVTSIDQRAFYNCGVTTFYGEAGSAIQTWCTTYNKNFSTEYANNNSVVNTSGLTFAQVIDPKSILDSYDLGSGKALPNVSAVFNDSFRFNFNFDNTKDSLEDVIENTVPQVNNDTMSAGDFASLNAVAKIVHNKRINLGTGDNVSDDGSDTVRPLIDEKVTDITHVNHNEYDSSVDPTVYYDVDIPYAVETKGREYKTQLFGLRDNYLRLANAAKAFDSTNENGISGNVQQKITSNIANIKGDLFAEVDGVEKSFPQANADRLYELYKGSGTVNYQELIDANDDIIADYNSQKSTNTTTINSLNDEIATDQARIDALDALIDAITNESGTGTLDVARANRTTKQGQLDDKYAEYNTAVANHESQETINALLSEGEALQTELDALDASIETLETTLDEYQSERDTKASAIAEKSVQIQNLNAENEDLTNKITILQESNADYQTILNDSVSKLQPTFFNIQSGTDTKIRLICPTCKATGTVAGGAFTYHSGDSPYFECTACNATFTYGAAGTKNSGYNSEDFIFGRDDIEVYYDGETPVMVEKQANGTYKRLDTGAAVTVNSDGSVAGLRTSIDKLVDNYISTIPTAPSTPAMPTKPTLSSIGFTAPTFPSLPAKDAKPTSTYKGVSIQTLENSVKDLSAGRHYCGNIGELSHIEHTITFSGYQKIGNNGSRSFDSPYYKTGKVFTTDHYYNFHFAGGSRTYITKGAYLENHNGSNDHNAYFYSPGTSDTSNPTYIHVCGDMYTNNSTGDGSMNFGDNTVLVIDGNWSSRKNWAYFHVGENSTVIVNGNMEATDGATIDIGKNSTVWINDFLKVSGNGCNLTLNDGAKLIVGSYCELNKGGTVKIGNGCTFYVNGYFKSKDYNLNFYNFYSNDNFYGNNARIYINGYFDSAKWTDLSLSYNTEMYVNGYFKTSNGAYFNLLNSAKLYISDSYENYGASSGFDLAYGAEFCVFGHFYNKNSGTYSVNDHGLFYVYDYVDLKNVDIKLYSSSKFVTLTNSNSTMWFNGGNVYAYAGTTFYCAGDFNGNENGSGMEVGEGSTVYIGGTYNAAKDSKTINIAKGGKLFFRDASFKDRTFNLNDGDASTDGGAMIATGGTAKTVYINHCILNAGNKSIFYMTTDLTSTSAHTTMNIGTNALFVVKGTYTDNENDSYRFNVGNNSRVFIEGNCNVRAAKSSFGNNVIFVVKYNYWNPEGGVLTTGTDCQLFIGHMMEIKMFTGATTDDPGGDLTLGDRTVATVGRIWVHGGDRAVTHLGSEAKIISTLTDSTTAEGMRGIDCSTITTTDNTSTLSSKTNIYCGNSAGISVANLFCETGAYVNPGTLTINNRAVIGKETGNSDLSTNVVVRPGAVLVTPSVSGSLTMGAENADPTVVVIGTGVNVGSNDLCVYENSTLYTGGSIVARNLRIWPNAKIHSDGNISLSGILDGANASNWVLSCKGDITSTANSSSSGNGVGTGSYLFCEGKLNTYNCDFHNNGTVYCAVNGTDSQMQWNSYVYSGSSERASQSADGALYLPDGYMYLSGYSGGSVPITGTQKWKLDFGFRFKTSASGDDAYYNSDNYSFIKMYVYDGNLGNPTSKNASRCYFQQNANGTCYTWEPTPTAGGQEQGKSITANNGNLSVGVNYHYIAEYTGDRFKAYITDDNGNVVQNIADTTDSTFLGRLSNIGPNGPNDPNVTVGSIKIGDDDGHYYFKGLEYRNITFFSGDAQNVWTPIASTDFTSLPNAIEGNLGYLDTYNQGFKSGHLDNVGGACLYSNGEVDINGHISNTGDIFAKGNILSTQYITNNTRAYIVTNGKINTGGVLTNGDSARLYAKRGINANGFTGNAGQYTLIEYGDMNLTGDSTFKGQTHIGGPYQEGYGYLNSSANVYVEGSLTVNGHPYNNNDPLTDFSLGNRVKGINASLLEVKSGGKVYCQGQVVTAHNVNVYANSGDRDEFSCLVIDGGKNKSNSDNIALTVGDRISIQRNTGMRYSSAQIYVDGNVNVGSYDNKSFYSCSDGAFMTVTGKLKLDYGINNGNTTDFPVNSYLSANQLEVTHGDCYFGVQNIRTADIADGTGFYIGNTLGTVPDNFTAVDVKEGKLHIYTTAYIGGSVNTSGDFAVDDWAKAYIGGNITSGGGFYQFNSSEAYIGKRVNNAGSYSGADGNVTIGGNTFTLADENNFGSVFCTGDFTASNASLTSQGECSLLVDKTLTVGGGITADFASGEGAIFARDGINFNAATITVYPIFYTDGNIRSNYGSESVIYVQYMSYCQPNTGERLKNCRVEAQEVTGHERVFELDSDSISGSGSLLENLSNFLSGDATAFTAESLFNRTAVVFNGTSNMWTYHTIKTAGIVSHRCRILNIARNQVVQVKGYDLIIEDDIINAGKIICLADEHGNGGNIIIRNHFENGTNGSWAHIENTGTIYCDGNFRVEGTNHGNYAGGVFGAQTNYGLSLKNGSSSNPRGEVYVGGELLTYGAVDNFSKIYVANDVHTTTLIRGTTEGYSDTGTDNNNGLDNEPNSVLMAGGSITADINPDNNNAYNTAVEKSSGTHYDETIIARRNSVLLALGNVRCSYGFIVGEARMDTTSSRSENGTKQFQWLSMQGYSGLDASKAGWIKTDAYYTGERIQLSTDESSEYYYLNYQGDVFDEYGQPIDVTAEDNKTAYYYYSSSANGRSGVTAKDFGFAYIGGTLTTSSGGYDANSYNGTHNFIRNFGKSVIYVANNTVNDGYRNPRGNAVDTGYTTLWPYSRMYVGGNYRNNLSPTSDSGSTTKTSVGFDAAFYSQLYVNGDYTAYDKIKIRDATKVIIAGDFNLNHSILSESYFELGKSPDEDRTVKDAWDENNLTLLQVNGNFTSNGYTKIFERATMNVGGDFTNVNSFSFQSHYLTLRHHAALRVGGNASCSAADIGSCSTLFVGKEFQARSGTIKVRDACDVSVGGNGGGDMTALSYIEMGKHEDEAYKYNSWSNNRGTSPFISDDDIEDINIDDESHFSDSDTNGDSTGDENYATAVLTCPNCGRNSNQTSFTRNTSDVKDQNNRTMYSVYTFTCGSCGYTFDESNDAFEDDGATGASAYVNGTINSKTGYLKLFANTKAYAVETVRSYRYISLRHHAGLYVLTNTNNGTGSMFSYDNNGRLLDYNGNVIPNFYVDTNPNSTEYGNIYYYKAGQDLYYQQDEAGVLTQKQLSKAASGTAAYDLYHSGVRIYGFSVKIDTSTQESFDGSANDDKTKGILYQNMLYFYLNGEKVYPYTVGKVSESGEDRTYLNYAYINFEYNLVLDAPREDGTIENPVADDYIEKPVGTAVIGLPKTSGSIISYGDLTVNAHATAYATGDVNSYGKTFIGNEGLIFSKGNYQNTGVISLSSLFEGNSVCGFEMKHGHLYAAGDVKIYSPSEIGGGTIDAGNDITFDSVYTHYEYNEDTDPLSNSYTDPTEVDLFICSEQGNINFNSIYSWTGGITYAPGTLKYTTNAETGKSEYSKSGGTISINGVYFEHFGAFIARDNNINSFYINLHRLANLKTLDLKTVSPSNVYLCPIESTD